MVIKAFDIKTELLGFKNEYRVLKKIKRLKLKDNGGFPLIVSVKETPETGEILMTYVGKDIHNLFKLEFSFANH